MTQRGRGRWQRGFTKKIENSQEGLDVEMNIRYGYGV